MQLRSALDIEPRNARALNGLACVMGQRGKDGALAYAQKANELVAKQPEYMDTLAVLLAERKDFARAVDLQRRAVEMQPGDARLRMNLAKIYVKSGDKELAKVELRRLAKLGDKSGMQSEVESLLKTL